MRGNNSLCPTEGQDDSRLDEGDAAVKFFGRANMSPPMAADPHFAVPDDVPSELISVGQELSRLEESARWSSQNQFEQGKFWRGCNVSIGIPASILGLASGGAGLSNILPVTVVGLAAFVAAALTGTMTVLGAERRAQRTQSCANAFHDVQDDARRMLLVDLRGMTLTTSREQLRALAARYSEIRHTADAPAKIFYKKAGRNIRRGGQSHAIDNLGSSLVPKGN